MQVIFNAYIPSVILLCLVFHIASLPSTLHVKCYETAVALSLAFFTEYSETFIIPVVRHTQSTNQLRFQGLNKKKKKKIVGKQT